MSIIRRSFPNSILVLANSQYFFGPWKNKEDFLKVVYKFKCRNIATVYLTMLGAIGFDFHDGEYLTSIESLVFRGDGQVPEEVLQNEDKINILQQDRMQFVNFLVGALFGRISAKRHTGLGGALFNGQDKITAFGLVDGAIHYQRSKEFEDSIRLKMNMTKAGVHPSCIISIEEIKDAALYLRGLWERQYEFDYADLISCLVMNYQAAILNNQQHASASLALNFSVMESLTKEIFYYYGLVEGSLAKTLATKEHHVSTILKNHFKKKSMADLTKILHDGALIGYNLFGGIEEARKKRNNLMHKGHRVSPNDSGYCQTVVRDLWAYLIDQPFELNAVWSYRR